MGFTRRSDLHTCNESTVAKAIIKRILIGPICTLFNAPEVWMILTQTRIKDGYFNSFAYGV